MRSESNRSAGSVAATGFAGLSLVQAQLDVADVFPFAPGKGWYAFNRQGKSIYFLERLFRMLSSPDTELRRHPNACLGDVIRWMSPQNAEALGVPHGVAAFEILNTDLFEAEVYPQFKSGSFRKTAKHWCILSPQPVNATVQKLSVKCMYVPFQRALESGVMEQVDCDAVFRPVNQAWSTEELERYIQTCIRPLEERIRNAALHSSSATRERPTTVHAREFYPPEKRARTGFPGHRGQAPTFMHANSCYM